MSEDYDIVTFFIRFILGNILW